MMLWPRESGQFVSKNCSDVTICDEKVQETAKLLVKKFEEGEYSMKEWKKHTLHPKEANEQAIDFIFAIDTLNFSFWPDVEGERFCVEYDGKAYTGYWSLVAALKRALELGIPVTSAEYMSAVTMDKFKAVFKSDSKTEIPLVEERLKCFNQAGKVLLEKFNGKASNIVKLVNKDAKKFIEIIVSNFKSFKDESKFNDQEISFYKRAQILVADIWLCFEGKGLGEFTNIDELTMFADYRVPQSLEYFGILEYSQALKSCLRNRTVLTPGHKFEIAIRGCSIEAIERLTKIIKSSVSEVKRTMVNSVTVDNFLWDYAREHREDMEHLPIHLVRTIYY